MFKSGGYFKGVSCPFYLRGGCPRVYCPFRHAKRPTACPTHWPKDIVLPVKEEVRDADEAGPSDGNFPLDDIITASDWTSSLSSKEGNFYGTSTKNTYSTTNRKKTPSLGAGSYSAVVSHAEATPLAADSVDEAPSATVRDIFGSGSEDETESLSFLDDATGGGSKDKVGGAKAEVVGARSGTSDDDFEQFVRAEVASGEEEAKRQAVAQVLFTKVLSGLNGEGAGGDMERGRGPSTDSALTKYDNKGVKSKRRAHPNAGTLRDPAMAVPPMAKSRTIQSKFSEQLADPEAVFTYQKRLSHCKQQESQSDHNSVAQRPRLKTTVNAKIPTAIRQKFLDGFVDEHLKMAASVQCAYQQALGEEAALEQRSRSRMLYINLAGNHLRALRERAGGGRSTALGPSPEEGSAGEGCSRQPEQSRPGAKRVRRVAALPPNKARKLEAAASTVLPLDALMPSRDQLAEGGVDKQLLSSLGAGKVASAATSSSVGTPPGERGKASVAAKVQGKCARKCRTTPKGTQSMASSVATTSGSVATGGGNVATVKSNSSLQEMFGSDSDSEGWEEQESWEQTMAVRAASSKGSAAVSGKKSKAKSDSRGSGAKEGAAHDAPRPHPPAKANWSIVPANQPEELTEELFYRLLTNHVLSEEDLVQNSYPRPTGVEGVAFIRQEVDSSVQPTPSGANAERHHCCRCGQPFLVYENGRYQDVDECVYHYGKLRQYRDAAQGVVLQFSCCSEPQGAAGCQVAQMHVTAGRKQERETGFVETGPSPSKSSGQSLRVLALDCEMCYTTVGLALARVTVVDRLCDTVYDTLVRPPHPIVDYNTRFSGLTAQHFTSDVTTSLTDVQAQLLSMVSMETILLGHSLNNDLRALKVIHSRVVDTALVFPHRLGPPYKKALKTLAAQHLGKIIQDSAEGGHDCAEDATCCMQLMLRRAHSDHLQSLRSKRGSVTMTAATARPSEVDT